MLIGKQSKDAIIDDFAKYISKEKVEMFKRMGLPFVLGKREGCRIWDIDGDVSLINCRSSGGVFNLGHRPRKVIEALKAALDELDIGDHLLLSEHRAALAKRLAEITPGDLHHSCFGVSGGEAIDLAIKLARAYVKKPGIISAIGGYHGHTGFALAAGDPRWREPFGPMAPGFTQVPFGDADALEAAMGDDTAAVIYETIPATLGMPMASPDFFPRVRELCDRAGVLLILDEVQSGLARTGRTWACEHWDVVPDVMVLAKGMSGAIYPLTVTIFREKFNTIFESDPFIHISTLGGSELGCVTAMAMLDEITAPGFLDHVNEMASIFAEGFARLRKKMPGVLVEVRQKGLMIGLVLADPLLGELFMAMMALNGVLCVMSSNDERVIQIMPPLIISKEEIGEVLEALDKSLTALPDVAKARLGIVL